MGNRAIVKPEGKDVGVYLHWNGGIDSVTAFLKYCELKQHRGFDDEYGMARFCQVVGNFFGGNLSLGIETDVRESEIEDYCQKCHHFKADVEEPEEMEYGYGTVYHGYYAIRCKHRDICEDLLKKY